jgi:hypothetical protein
MSPYGILASGVMVSISLAAALNPAVPARLPTVTAATQAINLFGSFTPTCGCRYVFKAPLTRRPGT